jgi:hypothetical protein
MGAALLDALTFGLLFAIYMEVRGIRILLARRDPRASLSADLTR